MNGQIEKPKLLVVDDDPLIHRQVEHIAGGDFSVETAFTTTNVTDAMLCDLNTLVLDLNLPDGDAIGFMQSLATRSPGIRLVLVSGLEPKTIKLAAAVARQLQFRSVETACKPLTTGNLAPLLHQCTLADQRDPEQSDAPSLANSLELGAELHRALAQNEFQSYFQPQVDLHSGLCVGAEALCRWVHPTLGVLEPATFIKELENGPLCMAFTLYMVDDAIQRFQRAVKGAGFEGRLSVNIPVAALEDSRLAAFLIDILRKHWFSPSKLIVEITERGITNDSLSIRATIASMRIHGMKISLDDFGTGYSSFEKLKNIAVDEIKIDRLFISDITHSYTSQTLAAAALEIAKHLNLRVVAEGVETDEVANWLAAHVNLIAQGYLYSRALEVTKFSEHIHNKLIATTKITPKFNLL